MGETNGCFAGRVIAIVSAFVPTRSASRSCTRKDSVDHNGCRHARGRGRGRFRRAPMQADLSGAASTSRFSEIVVRGFGWTMARGRSAPMLTSASPGRAAMVPAPVEASEVRGHRQRSPISAAPTVGALSLARSALRPPRIGKISGIWPRYSYPRTYQCER
jgi:hypothetical protein